MSYYGRDEFEAKLLKKVIKSGNKHILHFWNELTDAEKDFFIDEIERLDFKTVNRYFSIYENSKKIAERFSPPKYRSLSSIKGDKQIYKIGEKAFREGEVAFLTVAGGQGSRLGSDMPKGCFPISPIKKKSLFQLFAEKVAFYSAYYENDLKWYIMTSEENYHPTKIFFEDNNYFNLKRRNVIFFNQGMLPTLTLDGKMILRDKNKILLNPDGHGGILKALLKMGLLDDMKKNSIKYLSYCQVDNPLARLADPYFLGAHIKENSYVSTKVVKTLYPEEKMGRAVEAGGVNKIVEYSDLTKEELNERDSNGESAYGLGSIAVHIFNVPFLLRCTKKLELHFAKKRSIGYKCDENKNYIKEEMDTIKFETFVFDTIPLAKRSIFFETRREDEFAPLKNREGVDSIETSTLAQIDFFAEWLIKTNLVSREAIKGKKIEISPTYAPNFEIFLENEAKESDKLKSLIYSFDGSVRDEIYIE